MSDLERTLEQKNPMIAPRENFVDSVMVLIPDEVPHKKSYKVWRVVSLPLTASVTAAGTFALLALLVLPSIRSGNVQRQPVANEKTNAAPVVSSPIIVDEPIAALDQVAVEKEIVNFEAEIVQLEKDISTIEAELSDEALGLN